MVALSAALFGVRRHDGAFSFFLHPRSARLNRPMQSGVMPLHSKRAGPLCRRLRAPLRDRLAGKA
jgi:hypothetical protein